MIRMLWVMVTRAVVSQRHDFGSSSSLAIGGFPLGFPLFWMKGFLSNFFGSSA